MQSQVDAVPASALADVFKKNTKPWLWAIIHISVLLYFFLVIVGIIG